MVPKVEPQTPQIKSCTHHLLQDFPLCNLDLKSAFKFFGIILKLFVEQLSLHQQWGSGQFFDQMNKTILMKCSKNMNHATPSYVLP